MMQLMAWWSEKLSAIMSSSKVAESLLLTKWNVDNDIFLNTGIEPDWKNLS